MTPLEFGTQLDRMKMTYGEKAFPEERMKIMFIRYNQFSAKAFALAVDWVVLSMPSPGNVVSALDEKLSYAKREAQESVQVVFKFGCEPCRDFGYGWIGDIIVACTCDLGHKISPQELAKQQRNYNAGKLIMEKAKKGIRSVTTPLPYDPSERISGGAW